MGEKNHVCPVCQKRFAALSDLRKHLQVHTGERKFICDVCGGTFSGHMQRHMRTHEQGYINPKSKMVRKPKKLSSLVTLEPQVSDLTTVMQNETPVYSNQEREIYTNTDHILQQDYHNHPLTVTSPSDQHMAQNMQVTSPPIQPSTNAHEVSVANVPSNITPTMAHQQLATVPTNYTNMTSYPVAVVPHGVYTNVPTTGNNANTFSTIQMAMANWMTFQPH